MFDKLEVLLALALARRHERVERLGESTLRTVGLHLVAELHHELAQRLELRSEEQRLNSSHT